MVGTGLERDVERRPACVLPRDRERRDLGVRCPAPVVPALADDLALTHHHGPDERMGGIDVPAPLLGQLERPLEAHARAWTRRR